MCGRGLRAFDTVDGPELAAHALRSRLVDELQLIRCPVIVGGGKRFFLDDVRLDLDLIEERRFRRAWSFCATPPATERCAVEDHPGQGRRGQ